MAAIGNIRKHSTLLIVVVGLAMLLFILGDLVGGNSIFFQQSQNAEVGEINGHKISAQEFELAIGQAKRARGGQANQITEEQYRQLVWEQMVRKYAIEPEYEALGLSVTDEEVYDMIKNNPNNPLLRNFFSDPNTGQVYQQFTSPLGGISSEAVSQYLANIYNNEDEQAVTARNIWEDYMKNIKSGMADQKYNSMISQAIYTPADLAMAYAVNTENKVSFQYVAKMYSAIPDEQVTYTDADIQAYYNQHKNENRFQQKDDVRSLDYVMIPVVPSENDIENAELGLADMKNAFANSTDDTLFVRENADSPIIRYFKSNELPGMSDSMMFNSPTNTVYGPMRNGNFFALYKVKDVKTAPDSVRASHILIPVTEDSASAIILADSLFTAAKRGGDFAELAKEYSTDGSAANGGDLNWFTEGRMVPEFNDACFNGSTGDIVKVTTQFGIHIIKITDQTAPVQKSLIAVLDSQIEASKATFNDAYAEATKIAVGSSTEDEFNEAGAAYAVRSALSVRAADQNIQGIPNSRQVVKWAYEANEGDISEVFSLEDQFIVARVKSVVSAGTMPLTMVKSMIEQSVKNEKKAEIITSEFAGKSDLNALAQQTNTTVLSVDGLAFNDPSIPGLGQEQKLQGTAFALNVGEVSSPIEGTRGVYVIKITYKGDQPINDLTTYKLQSETRERSTKGYQVSNALRESSDITDNRAILY